MLHKPKNDAFTLTWRGQHLTSSEEASGPQATFRPTRLGRSNVTRNERITRAAGENKCQAGSDKRSIFAKPRMDEDLERANGLELRVAHIDPATGVKDPGAGHRNSVWD